MSDWVYLTDAETNVSYYANTTTHETSWRPPLELGGLMSPHVKLPNGWFQYEDDATGRFYYYHKHTKRTQWVMPEEARPPAASERDASVFEAGLRDEPEGAGEEEDEDDDFVDEPDDVDGYERGRADSRQGSEAEAAADKEEKRAARRLKILEEILLSERAYVSALSILKRVYIVPLRTVADMPAGRGQIFTHADLDTVFVNIELIIKVNEDFLRELETELQLRRDDWRSVRFGEIIQRAVKQFKGCYTRYVTKYDTAQAHLTGVVEGDREKQRYLDVCKTHPDAGGHDVHSFLIQPVQRVPRYRMLLEDLLAHTDVQHADEGPLRASLATVCDVAVHINEQKRHVDEVERMRELVGRFANGQSLEKELVSYERRLLKEGLLSKMRQSKKQLRHVFLCSDVLLYAARPSTPAARGQLLLKGKIWLKDVSRLLLLPSTEEAPHAFALIARGGKGYTWLAESEYEQKEFFEAIQSAVAATGSTDGASRPPLQSSGASLAFIGRKMLSARLEAVSVGALLTKYNLRDGKSAQKWVRVVESKLLWGEPKGKKCFTIVFKERTLDFAVDSAEDLLDFYLVLASKMPHSTEKLLDESELRARIESGDTSG